MEAGLGEVVAEVDVVAVGPEWGVAAPQAVADLVFMPVVGEHRLVGSHQPNVGVVHERDRLGGERVVEVVRLAVHNGGEGIEGGVALDLHVLEPLVLEHVGLEGGVADL